VFQVHLAPTDDAVFFTIRAGLDDPGHLGGATL
jgi:hypothetical protein